MARWARWGGWVWLCMAATLVPAGLLLTATGLDPWAAWPVAFGAMAVLTAVAAMVWRPLRPGSGFARVLGETAMLYIGIVVIVAVLAAVVWLESALGVHEVVAWILAIAVAIGVGVVAHRWVVPRLPGWFTLSDYGARRERRRAGLPETDHPVTIVKGDPGDGPPFLMATCDGDDCGWMEFSQADNLAEQERELRALAAKHTTAVVPPIQ